MKLKLNGKTLSEKNVSNSDRYNLNELIEKSNFYGIELNRNSEVPPCSPAYDDDYGDPVNKRFPLSPDSKLEASIVRFSQFYKQLYKEEKSIKNIASRIIEKSIQRNIKPLKTSKIFELSGLEPIEKNSSEFFSEDEINKKLENLIDDIDESVISSFLIKGNDTLSISEIDFNIEETWKEYLENFELRKGISLHDFVEAINKNDEGLHEHLNSDGSHNHDGTSLADGSHNHDQSNPFGLHSHSNQPLGGAHWHGSYNGSMGSHNHGPQNRINYNNINDEDLPVAKKYVDILKFSGSIEESAFGIVYGLKKALSDLDNHFNYTIKRLNEKIKDEAIIKLNNIFLGLNLMLAGDLKLIEFTSNKISGFYSFNITDILNINEDVNKYYESSQRYVDTWEIDRINSAYESLKAIISLLSGLLNIVDESEYPELYQIVFDTLVINKVYKMKFAEIIYMANDYGVVSVMNTPIINESKVLDFSKRSEEENIFEFVIKSKIEKEDDSEDDIDKRVVTGIILRPNVRDLQNQQVGETNDEGESIIRKAMFDYMMNNQVIGLMHTKFNKATALNDPDYRIVECWQSRNDEYIGNEFINKGTWMMSAKILSDKIWKRIQKGELRGWSIGGNGKIKADIKNG